jgi:hypothetical protein
MTVTCVSVTSGSDAPADEQEHGEYHEEWLLQRERDDAPDYGSVVSLAHFCTRRG